ncbi:response regulator [Denitrobaculum tricleocarpae]|uniref:Response regulator n=1 Tax=Denitrobaculum tricleocarpae TaxID=2591009 RepID=A0A545SYM5_9PROT|nr:response regulator [Denitrobaculum tricleocarpae]TQV70070.1 response regulator [Denitrobaculum tricleocarpae]
MDTTPIEILLVEDNPGDVRLTQEALASAKILTKMNSVLDGETALRFLHREGEFNDSPRPDLIILDLNLPRVSGHEVLASIKEHEHLRRIPVVVLTSSEAEEDIVRSYDLHANCYVRKPVDMSSFIDVVNGIEDFWFTVVRLP